MRPARQTALFLTALGAALGAALVTACGPVGGGGDDMNKGSYTIEEFNYKDPYGVDHHPLRGTTTAVLGNAEIAFLGPQSGTVIDPDYDEFLWPMPAFELSATGQLDDDPSQEFLVGHYVPGQTGLLSLSTLDKTHSPTWQPWGDLPVGPTAPLALATGDTDKDGRAEVAVVWSDGVAPRLSVLDDGLLVFQASLFDAYPDVDLQHIELGLADLDADGQDEIAVLGSRGPYWNQSIQALPVLALLDDALTGHQQLVETTVTSLVESYHGVSSPSLNPPGQAGPAQLVLGDFDRGHAGMEICVSRLVVASPKAFPMPFVWFQYESLALDADSGELLRWHMGAVDDGWMHVLALNWLALESLPDSFVGFDVTAADLDGDGSEELISTWFKAAEGNSGNCNYGKAPFLLFAIPLDLTAQEVDQRWKVPDAGMGDFFQSYTAEGTWEKVGVYTIVGPPHGPVSTKSTTCTGWPDFQAPRWKFAAGDYDNDARDELYLTGWDGGWDPDSPAFSSAAEAVKQPDGRYSLEETWTGPEGPLTAPPHVLACDWDGDEVRVRYTGEKKLALGTPLPLVLMAAPPTKADIEQNYSGSHTTYETSNTYQKAYSVKLGVTVGSWAGCEAEDILGLTSASARVKFEAEMAGTLKKTFMVTESSGNKTGYDEDVILFQGTLYYSYPYEVVCSPNPDAIGRILTLDVPVGTNVYMWTADYYNATVDPQFAIPPELLVHDIGDPASYMTEGQAEDLLDDDKGGYVGWKTDSETVGMGSGARWREIKLEYSAGSALSLGWKVTGEAEIKVGAFVGGASYGVFGEAVYEVTTAETTCFRGEVGNIKGQNSPDYYDWLYKFGLVTYTHGLLCDENNEPIGIEEGVLPLQVETYYTEAIGPGYQ